jgi:SAM-dependent methyltransferase
MLQLKTAGYKVLSNLRSAGVFPVSWLNMAELQQKTDEVVSRFLDERFKVSQELGGGFFLSELLDRAIRTSETEYMDQLNVPERERLEMVQALDRQNTMMQLYPRYVDILLPLMRDVIERKKREVRILELASGAGGLVFELAASMQRKKLPFSITGSDIVPAFIEEGNLNAAKKKLPVNFKLLNAFNLEEQAFTKEEFDLVVISHSLHHFSPGQLAIMIAQSAKYTTTAFVGIDGFRSLLLTGGVPFVAALQGIGPFALDGLISARKFYSELELDIIAEIATGKKNHTVSCSWPQSVLTIRFDSTHL